jgi:hypothetical protein
VGDKKPTFSYFEEKFWKTIKIYLMPKEQHELLFSNLLRFDAKRK